MMRLVLGLLKLLSQSKGLRWVALLAFYAGVAGFEALARPEGAAPAVVSWAVFLGAGPALAGALLEGGGAWLAVFFGALFAQALVHGTAPVPNADEMSRVQGDLIIAGFAALQAVAGAWLIRRVFGVPLRLAGWRGLGLLLFLAGPLMSLVVLTAACCAGLLDQMPLTLDLVAGGLVGWVVSFASVFLVLPLVLLHPWREDSLVCWRGTQLPRFSPRALGYVLMSLSGAILVWSLANGIVAHNNQQQFRVLAEDGDAALVARIDSYNFGLSAAAAMIRASDMVSDRDWRRFVGGLDIARHLPGAEALGFVVPVPRDGLAAYVARTRAETGSDFTPHPASVAQGEGPLLLVRHIAPESDWRGLLGLNLAHDPAVAAIAREARDSGKARLSPRLRSPSAPDQGAGPGFVLLHPVYAPGKPVATVAERRAAFLGWTAVTFTAPRLAHDLSASLGRDMQLSLTQAGDNATFFHSSPDAGISGLQAYRASRTVQLYGRDWVVSWTSTPGFERALHRFAPALVLIGGLAFTVLLAVFLLSTGRREELIRETVSRKTSEIAQQEAENRSIIDTALVMIALLDGEGVILRANDAIARLFGLRPESLPGMEFSDLTGGQTAEYFTRAGEPGDTTGFRGTIHTSSKTGEALALDIQIRSWLTDGNARRYTVVMRNIAQRLRIEAQLRDTQHRLDVALQGAKIGVFDVDLTTGESIVSDTWRDLLGFARDEPVDTQNEWRNRIDPEDLPVVEAADMACINGETDTSITDYRVQTVGGEWRWMRSHAVAAERDETGRAQRLIGVQMDVTEERMLDQAKREFVSTVSHELRTPLTSINGSLSLVLNTTRPGEIPERALRLLTIAQKNCDRLIPLVNDILDLEKVASGQTQFSFSEEDVGALVRRSLADNKPYADQYEVRLRLVAAEAGLVARIDANRFLQVMANLLSNAAKFSEHGGVVEVRMLREGAVIRISVTDHGKGIPPSFHERIFRPFSQADSSATRAKGGTGLGLNITKQIVERMGGEIGFASQPEVATEFWFTLPLAASVAKAGAKVEAGAGAGDAAAAAPGMAEASAPAPRAPDMAVPVILHVEDDTDFAEVLAAAFGKRACLVQTGRDTALAALSSRRFDLVLLESAEAGGEDVVLIDAAAREQAGVPMVALTAADKAASDPRIARTLIKSRARLEEIVALCLPLARPRPAARTRQAGAG